MKKNASILIFNLLLINIIFAQNPLKGSFLFESVIIDGKEQSVDQFINFDDDANMIVMDISIGKWTYNTTTKKIHLDANGLTGEYHIINDNDNIQLTSSNVIINLLKIDFKKLTEDNANSGLIGSWGYYDTLRDRECYLKFDTPTEFTHISKEFGMSSKYRGKWWYQPETKRLLLRYIGDDELNGFSRVEKLDINTLQIAFESKQYTLHKKEAQNVERLTFTTDDFYDDKGNYRYYSDEDKLPWKNASFYGYQTTFANIKEVTYRYSIWLEQTQTFEIKDVTAQVNVDLEGQKPMLTFDYIFNGYDRESKPEGYSVDANYFDEFNHLYPYRDITYRVAGAETINTSLGAYECTVIEAIASSDTKVKLWMINDMPGIYAKIIQDKAGDFGYYYKYELKEFKH